MVRQVLQHRSCLWGAGRVCYRQADPVDVLMIMLMIVLGLFAVLLYTYPVGTVVISLAIFATILYIAFNAQDYHTKTTYHNDDEDGI